jgi:hypothetical protein
VLAFAAGGKLVWASAERAVVLFGATRSPMALDLVSRVQAFVAELAVDKTRRRVGFVGDSMLEAPPGETALPERALDAANRRVPGRRQLHGHALSVPAVTPIGEYCVLDELIDGKPDLIALELNLRALQPGPLGPFSYAEFSGWIRASRLREAAFLPLSDAQITLDRLLFYRFLVASHSEDAWRALLDRQATVLNTRDLLEGYIERRTGVSTSVERRLAAAGYGYARLLVPGTAFGTVAHVESMLGSVLQGVDSENPRLKLLRVLLMELRAAGIPTLVWVSPVNVDHMRSIGLSMDGLERSMGTIRAVVESAGASFLDLHDALRREAFRDSGDHYTYSGKPDGTAIVGARLGAAVKAAATIAPH